MESDFIRMTTESLYLILELSAPCVMGALIVGLLVSLVQATTQIQEQTLTFVPKLVVVMLILAVSGHWTLGQLRDFTRYLMMEFPRIIQ